MEKQPQRKNVLIEDSMPEPLERQRLKLIYKIVCFAFGILSTVMICILIRLSDNLTVEKKKQALRHFEEIANHVIEQQNH
ncbi:uncharacterized protein LOC101459323 [Ceratitis capitata]|uniref:(Mediterranean fruit fly) hypothetical protein n=1 Tax=Ceratitis capitata TaxID=7213 RepID=A0A811UHX1_CERCA|nr:uncharacterized protein LOC101459323 [Ceratitis capitata]CAD6998812.1 unnamed protein product [Ceratitis capitata]